MVAIQIGSEQEEKKRRKEKGRKRKFEKIADINITSNAEEDFAGATLSSAEDFKFDMTLQLDGGREELISRKGDL